MLLIFKFLPQVIKKIIIVIIIIKLNITLFIIIFDDKLNDL